jgi:hypothetical protein
VQILETSVMGLRSARMEFRHRTSPVTVTLYPMVHIGERSFYDTSYDEAFSHDVTLIEGIRSPVSRHLTRSYRWLNLGRLGLTLQPKPPAQEAVRGKIVKADLSPDEFHREWRKIFLPLRAVFLILAPLVGMHRRLFGSREMLGRRMTLEDRMSADEILSWSPRMEPFHHSVLHARDERLIECLASELDSAEAKRVAVVYGAMHIRSVVRALGDRGFYCAEASWRTVFSI